mgnify:CR=1 FL=1
MAVFPNDAGLANIGNSYLAATPASGNPTTGNPGEIGFGTVKQGFLEASNVDMVSEITAQSTVIEAKNRENEALLLNVLPAPIANRLRGGEQSIADGFANVSVLFADIVGFTEIASTMPPQQVVSLLNGLFTRFDVAAHEVGIEKIKTVGDAYMAVCGLPQAVDDHIDRMVRMAIRMVHITREHALELGRDRVRNLDAGGPLDLGGLAPGTWRELPTDTFGAVA